MAAAPPETSQVAEITYRTLRLGEKRLVIFDRMDHRSSNPFPAVDEDW